jgi:glucose-6-phosphate dehydrogenase assembly protein OpcA
MYIKEIGCQDLDWSQLTVDTAQWRALVNMLMNSPDP